MRRKAIDAKIPIKAISYLHFPERVAIERCDCSDKPEPVAFEDLLEVLPDEFFYEC